MVSNAHFFIPLLKKGKEGKLTIQVHTIFQLSPKIKAMKQLLMLFMLNGSIKGILPSALMLSIFVAATTLSTITFSIMGSFATLSINFLLVC
jgi:hypothetical protein